MGSICSLFCHCNKLVYYKGITTLNVYTTWIYKKPLKVCLKH